MISIPVLNIQDFLSRRENTPIIDVRTPAEFAIGHICGASNVPLFSNGERAEVGTLYKQKSKEQAVTKGLELVGPKMVDILGMAKEVAKRKKLLLYCWRGGMRSYSVAWMLKLYGLDVCILQGGYQSYRRYLKQEMSRKAKFVVLGGLTGSGKTDILHEFQKQGEQVLDLEGLASHKGSAFGQIGEQRQRHNEFFENSLGEKWLTMDLNRTIWVEDEGRSIGKNFVPDEIFLQMRKSPVVLIDVPHSERINRLVDMYAQADCKELIASVLKIKKRLGGQRTKLAIDFIEQGDLEAAADVLLVYYDKSYTHALNSRDASVVRQIDLHDMNMSQRAEILAKIASTQIMQ